MQGSQPWSRIKDEAVDANYVWVVVHDYGGDGGGDGDDGYNEGEDLLPVWVVVHECVDNSKGSGGKPL